MTTVAYRSASEIVAKIRTLDLPLLTDSEIKLRKFAWDNSGIIHRGVTVKPSPERVRPFWPAQCDDIGYDFDIIMVMGNSDGGSEHIDIVDIWREEIRREFINQRLGLTPVPENYTCHVMHKDVYMPDQYRDSYDAGALVIRAWCREFRQ